MSVSGRVLQALLGAAAQRFARHLEAQAAAAPSTRSSTASIACTRCGSRWTVAAPIEQLDQALLEDQERHRRDPRCSLRGPFEPVRVS